MDLHVAGKSSRMHFMRGAKGCPGERLYVFTVSAGYAAARLRNGLSDAKEGNVTSLAATQHYRTYKPKPLTKEEIDHVEILFGGLHWRAERVLQAVFENLGYKARPLPTA